MSTETTPPGPDHLSPEIAPCPFCGHTPEMGVKGFANKFVLRCRNEECHVQPVSFSGSLSQKAAIEKWNTRAPATPPEPDRELMEAAEKALWEMRHTTAPRNSFTDAVESLSEILKRCRKPEPEAKA